MIIVHISDTPGPGLGSLNPHDDAEFELVWTEIKRVWRRVRSAGFSEDLQMIELHTNKKGSSRCQVKAHDSRGVSRKGPL